MKPQLDLTSVPQSAANRSGQLTHTFQTQRQAKQSHVFKHCSRESFASNTVSRSLQSRLSLEPKTKSGVPVAAFWHPAITSVTSRDVDQKQW